ncbi:MAG: J domain-containing protein [Bacteroidota bacterium]
MLEYYYKILGLKADADERALKKAYRKLALAYHPDVNSSPDAEEQFRNICEAYEIVSSHIQKQTTINAEYSDDSREEVIDPFVYEEIIREARKKAWERARMRYEKIKADKEFFENNDLIIILKYIGNYLLIPIILAMIIIPVYLAITESFVAIFATIFFWFIGIVLAAHIYSNRKVWFRPGKISTGWKDIVNFFIAEKKNNVKTECQFTSGKKANSTPFKLTMFKVRHVTIRNYGPFQHHVGYDRKYKEVIIPRSVKAWRIHFILSFLKPILFTLALIFIPTPSFIWKTIGAIIICMLISNLILWISKVRSKTSYLLNWFLIIKIIIWMLVITTQTIAYPGLVFFTEEFLLLYIILMLLFLDMFLDLIFRAFPFYNKIYLPLLRQPEIVKKLFKKGYQNFLDVPVWSTLYPFLRWLF